MLDVRNITFCGRRCRLLTKSVGRKVRQLSGDCQDLSLHPKNSSQLSMPRTKIDPLTPSIQCLSGPRPISTITSETIVVNNYGHLISPLRVEIEGPFTHLIRLRADSDLYLPPDYLVWHENRAIPASEYPGSEMVEIVPSIIFTLLFEKAQCIFANGIPIITRGKREF